MNDDETKTEQNPLHIVLLSFLGGITLGPFFGVFHPVLIPVPGIVLFLYLWQRKGRAPPPYWG
jgi:hypothetical protein